MTDPTDAATAAPAVAPTAPAARLRELVLLAVEQMNAVERAEEALAAAKAQLDRTQRTDMPELLNALGMSEVTLAELGVKVTLTGGVDISIPEPNRPSAYAWMVERGYGALVRAEVSATFGASELEKAEACSQLLVEHGFESEVNMAVPPPTLKAWARERLAAGEDIPPELFNVRAYDMARISNVKPKRKKA